MVRKIQTLILKPEIVLLIIGILAGIPLSIFVPYGAGFDEESHIVRVFDMARGHLIPNRTKDKGIAFIEFYSLSYKRRYLQTPANNMFDPQTFWAKADRQNATDAENHSTYSPAVFLLDAVIAFIAWTCLDLPVLPIIILIRIAGLCLFLLLGYFSVKLIPCGKWLLTILLLAPMTIYQASVINGDRFTIAAAFFFISTVLFTYSKKDQPIDRKQTILLILGAVLVGVSKSGTIILYALLLILLGRNFENKGLKWFFFAAIAASVIYSISWSMLVDMETPVQSLHTPRINQFKLILSNIPDFLKVYFVGIFRLIPRYYTDWAAEYGYWMGTVPWPVYVMYPIALLVAFLADAKNEILTKKTRWIIFLVGLGTLAIIASIKFIFYYVPGQYYFQAQGRYFIPFAPLVYLAFIELIQIPQKWQKIAVISSIAVLLITLGVYEYGAYRTYYTTCVYAVDATHPCKLPVYRNLDTLHPVNVDIKAGQTFKQSFDPECSPINSIDLYVMDVKGDSKGNVVLSFYDAEENFLSKSVVPIRTLQVGQQNRFVFDSTKVNGNLEYSFTIELSDDSSATISLWGVANDKYQKGVLTKNNMPYTEAADLYLQFECPR